MCKVATIALFSIIVGALEGSFGYPLLAVLGSMRESSVCRQSQQGLG